ncbi:MAG: YfcE family phosphodiesterase [Candidatus Bathyarchaeia archaeon]
MRKVLLLADIHANLPALTAVLDKAGPVDLVLNAGDIVDYGPSPLETISAVKEFQGITVMGNHDRDCAVGNPLGYNPFAKMSCRWTHDRLGAAERAYLLGLPRSWEAVLEGVRVFLCHGSPRNLLDEYVTPDYPTNVLEGFMTTTGAQILVLGHTHIPLLRRFHPDRYLVNPGSVGQPRDGDPRASYAVLTLGDSKALRLEQARATYDVREAAESILKAGLPPFLAERLYYGL